MTAKTIRMTMPLEMNVANQYVDHTEQQSAAPGWSLLSDVHDAFAPALRE
jgi:hypothetical protein